MPRSPVARVGLAALVLVTVAPISPGAEEDIVGRDEFLRSCAACHGVDGEGNGPVAEHLDPKPTDLTTMAERHGGTFPTLYAFHIVDGRSMVSGHGDRAMPVWGDRYRTQAAPAGTLDARRGAEPLVRARVMELVHYLTAIQEPRGDTLLPMDEP